MGYAPGEFPRTLSGFVQQIHPDDRPQMEVELRRIIESGVKGWNLEYRMRAADGTYRNWVDHGTVTEYTPEGHVKVGVSVRSRTSPAKLVREQKLEQALLDLEAARNRLAEENIYLQEELRESLDYSEIVGESEPWLQAMSQVRLVASMDTTILIAGETGTGKELLARALHDGSPRSGQALIKVNCAVLPSTLIESELFGHEKGAFSGAATMRRGRWELADGGTLFLDEIGELPPDLQAKLLHVLQKGEFERLGSSKTLKSDVRVIAATNRNLHQEIEAGRFRRDLFYRCGSLPDSGASSSETAPRTSRCLLTYFLERHNRKARPNRFRESPIPLWIFLQAYDWPGNVRELENLVERGSDSIDRWGFQDRCHPACRSCRGSTFGCPSLASSDSRVSIPSSWLRDFEGRREGLHPVGSRSLRLEGQRPGERRRPLGAEREHAALPDEEARNPETPVNQIRSGLLKGSRRLSL